MKFKNFMSFLRDCGVTDALALHRGTNASHDSPVVFNELLACLSEVAEKELLTDIRSSPFIGLGLDESTDRSTEKHLVVVVRYVARGACRTAYLLSTVLSDRRWQGGHRGRGGEGGGGKIQVRNEEGGRPRHRRSQRDGERDERRERPADEGQPTPCLRPLCLPQVKPDCVAGLHRYRGYGGSPVRVGSCLQLSPAESNTAGAFQGDGGGAGGRRTEVQAHLRDKVQHHILNF